MAKDFSISPFEKFPAQISRARAEGLNASRSLGSLRGWRYTTAFDSSGEKDIPVNVRQATISEMDDLVVLFGAYRTFYEQPADEELDRSFLLERFRHLQSVVFIAFEDDEAIGFTQLFPSFSSVQAAPIFILNDLFVAPAARGRGAGKALLAAASDYATKAGAVRLTLSTAADNSVAQSLYEAEGWTRETKFISYNLPLVRVG